MLSKFIIIVISLVLFSLLYFAGSSFLGPGLGDNYSLIGNGYMYEDSGYYEKVITFRNQASNISDVAIDSRVDSYVVIDDLIYVARRPRLLYVDKEVTKSKLSPLCEYWLIDMSSHEVKKLEDMQLAHDLSCSFKKPMGSESDQSPQNIE